MKDIVVILFAFSMGILSKGLVNSIKNKRKIRNYFVNRKDRRIEKEFNKVKNDIKFQCVEFETFEKTNYFKENYEEREIWRFIYDYMVWGVCDVNELKLEEGQGLYIEETLTGVIKFLEDNGFKLREDLCSMAVGKGHDILKGLCFLGQASEYEKELFNKIREQMKIDFKAMEIASNRVETRKSIIMWNLIIGLGIGSVLIPAVFHILFGI